MRDRPTYEKRPVAADDAQTLPQLPDFETVFPPEQPVVARFLYEDPLLLELIESRPVRRLKRIGFLGAIERVTSRNWHSRYDHSLGVEKLAILYASYTDLSWHEARLLAVAGLLHDIGHGPLSHTLEPIFRARFGISHHDIGARIIRGELPTGIDIPKMLAGHNVDADEVNAMINGTHHSRHAFLFSGPINLDTIEGIIRCHALYSRDRTKFMSAPGIVWKLSTVSELSTPTLDAFWQLKQEMYSRLIHYRLGLLYDGLAQAVMQQNLDQFKPGDFLKDEEQLRRSYIGLFRTLDCARRAPANLRTTLSQSLLDHNIVAPREKFYRNPSVQLKQSTDLAARYQRERSFYRIPICRLLSKEETHRCRSLPELEKYSNRASRAPIV